MTAEAENSETWLSVKEVAARWRISAMSVYRLIDSGDLKACKFGRSVRINLADVEQYEIDAVCVPEQQEATSGVPAT